MDLLQGFLTMTNQL